MSDGCLKILKRAEGQLPDAQDVVEYKRQASNQRRRLLRSDPAFVELPPEQQAKRVAEETRNVLLDGAVKKYTTAINNARKRQGKFDLVDSAVEKDASAVGAILGLFTRVSGNADTYGTSLITNTDAVFQRTVHNLRDVLMKSRLDFGRFSIDPEMQKSMLKAMFDPEQASPEMKNVVQAIRKVDEQYTKAYQAVGGSLNTLESYAVQKWGRTLVRKMGKEPWVEYMLPKVDRKLMTDLDGNPLNDAELRDSLGKMWGGITGTNRSAEDALSGVNHTGGFGLNKERRIHFKDAESYADAMMRFGDGDATQMTLRHYADMAVETYLIDEYGTNYQQNMRDLFRYAKIKDDERGVEHKTTGILGFKTEVDDDLVNAIIRRVTQGNIKNAEFASITQGMRNLIVSAKLGGMGINLLPDFASATAVAVRSGLTYGDGLAISAKELAKRVKDPTLRDEATVNVTMARHYIGGLTRIYREEVAPLKTAALLSSGTMSWGGGRATTSAIRSASFEAATRGLYNLARRKKYSELSEGDLVTAKNLAIDETTYNMLRTVSSARGEVPMDVEIDYNDIRNLPSDVVKEFALKDLSKENPVLQELISKFERQNAESVIRLNEQNAKARIRIDKLKANLAEARKRSEVSKGEAREKLDARFEQADIEIERLEANLDFSKALLTRDKAMRSVDDFDAYLESGAVDYFDIRGSFSRQERSLRQASSSVASLVSDYKIKMLNANNRAKRAEKSYSKTVKYEDARVEAKAKKTDASVEKILKEVSEVRDTVKKQVEARSEILSRLEKEVGGAVDKKAIQLVERAERAIFAFADDMVAHSQGELTALSYAQLGEAGSVGGELARFATQFTLSPVQTFINNTIRHFENAPLESKLAVAAQYLATALVLGTAAMQIQQLFSGADPLDFVDENGEFNSFVLMQAASRSFGVTQFLGLASPNSAEQQAAAMGLIGGPMAGYATMYLNIVGQIAGLPFADDFDAAVDRLADTSIRAARSSVPYSNIFYSKLVLDHAVFLNLQQMLAPETLSRRTERMRELYQMDYWWDPEDDLPQRLPLQDD